MQWARIENGLVVEVTSVDPAGRFHPEIEKGFIPCGNEVQPNWVYDGEQFNDGTVKS